MLFLSEIIVLTEEEKRRYSRQLMLFGEEVQLKLKKSRVAIVGAGGLGSPVAYYLAAAGIGKLRLIDYDTVSLSNLNRQILHWTSDIGKPKILSAKEKLTKLNPNVKIEVIKDKLSEANYRKLLEGMDLIIDALDNWQAKMLLNKACIRMKKPLIHAGVRGMYGQLLVIIPGKTPCLRCLIPSPETEIEKLPVFGTTPGVLGLIQVTEAFKLLTGYGEPLLNKLLIYDGYSLEFSYIDVTRNPNCPVCGEAPNEA